jgi:hypothetical protein
MREVYSIEKGKRRKTKKKGGVGIEDIDDVQ